MDSCRVFYDQLMAKLPGGVAASFDVCLSVWIRAMDRPLNGQVKRQGMLRDLLSAVPFSAVIETGTYRGGTAGFFAQQLRVPVYTVESVPRYYHYARHRLRRLRNARVFPGDSRLFLKQLSQDAAVPHTGVLFYLDAHWYDDLPVWEEVAIIEGSWTESVIVIDDFQVPDDPGYHFDDYGEAKRLSLPGARWSKPYEVFWPSVHSSVETGCRRGCILLATGDSLIEKMRAITSLRQISVT